MQNYSRWIIMVMNYIFSPCSSEGSYIMKHTKHILIILLVLCMTLLISHPLYASEYGWYKTCPRCGEQLSLVVYRAPTCDMPGMGFEHCEHCGYGYAGQMTFTQLATIYPLGHSYYSTVLRSASCTEGEQVQYTCSRCGSSYVAEGEPLGHDYTETVLIEVTCTKNGNNSYTCKRCGDTYEQTVEALGHDFIYDEKDPTCTEDGYKNGKCSRCDETTETVYPALGHTTKGKWTVERDPGYIRLGIETQVCSVCGETVSRSIPRKNPTVPLCCIAGVACAAGVVTFLLKKKSKAPQQQDTMNN